MTNKTKKCTSKKCINRRIIIIALVLLIIAISMIFLPYLIFPEVITIEETFETSIVYISSTIIGISVSLIVYQGLSILNLRSDY